MPEPQGIALSLSNRRPVFMDDPAYDKLLLALHAEDPSALQPDEQAYAETLLTPRDLPVPATQSMGNMPGMTPMASHKRSEQEGLATLRAIVDAGGPQQLVVSGARPPSLGGPRRPVLAPEGGEILGRARTLMDLLNNTPLGWLGDSSDPLQNTNAAGPIAGVLTPSRVAIATPTEIPAALGSLANTIKRGSGAAGPYALKAPVLERLRHFYKVGADMPSSANWESKPAELVDAFGGDQDAAHLWSRLWGATSPNTSVPVNTKESVSALLHYLETGEPMSMAAAQAKDDVGRQVITMAGSKVPNIRNAVAGQPLSGDKVEAMAGFMVGEPRTPIDVHTLYGLGSKGDKLGPELGPLRQKMTTLERLPLRGSLTDTDIYKRYEKALRNTLAEIEPGREVNPIFATTWEGVRTYKGLKPQGGPVDILRAKGLLKPGAMMDPGQLRQALKAAGWSAGAIGALMTGIKQEQP